MRELGLADRTAVISLVLSTTYAYGVDLNLWNMRSNPGIGTSVAIKLKKQAVSKLWGKNYA
jgi:hypothetical protein